MYKHHAYTFSHTLAVYKGQLEHPMTGDDLNTCVFPGSQPSI
jgi:hypothetical protein